MLKLKYLILLIILFAVPATVAGWQQNRDHQQQDNRHLLPFVTRPGHTLDDAWDHTLNRGLWSHGVDPDELAAQVSEPKPTDRGRVKIDPARQTVVTDNGFLLRGEHLRGSRMLSGFDNEPQRTHAARAMDLQVWTRLMERHNLNTIRYLLYRPPQNWSGGPRWDCPPDRCFETVEEALPYIDAMVEIASEHGMYLIIDYHPVLGHSPEDALAWWKVLAPRYKDRTHVIYEVINEPTGGADEYEAEDIALQEELYALVRRAAPDTHVILWSFADYEGAKATVQKARSISYDNASVGYHPYAWRPAELAALQQAGFPIIATELGDDLGTPPPDSRGYRWKTERHEELNVSWVWLDGVGWGKPWEDRDSVPITWARDPRTHRPWLEAPVIEPAGGALASGSKVRVTRPEDGTLGAQLRFTLDGTEPTADSPLYVEPVTMPGEGAVELKVKAFKAGYAASDTVTALFTLR